MARIAPRFLVPQLDGKQKKMLLFAFRFSLFG
jgi:hypothetical protein